MLVVGIELRKNYMITWRSLGVQRRLKLKWIGLSWLWIMFIVELNICKSCRSVTSSVFSRLLCWCWMNFSC